MAALQPWKEEANKQGSMVIGETKVFLQGLKTCQSGECNLGNLLTDSMVDYVRATLLRDFFQFLFLIEFALSLQNTITGRAFESKSPT